LKKTDNSTPSQTAIKRLSTSATAKIDFIGRLFFHDNKMKICVLAPYARFVQILLIAFKAFRHCFILFFKRPFFRMKTKPPPYIQKSAHETRYGESQTISLHKNKPRLSQSSV
jgi:hypothetical protein